MENKQCKGYTLLSPNGPAAKATLVDMDGKIVKQWDACGNPARMLPDGSMIGYRTTRQGKIPDKPDDPPSKGGDPDKTPPRPWFDNIDLVQLSWDDQEMWTFRDWDDDRTGVMMARQHHDWEMEGNPVGYYAPG